MPLPALMARIDVTDMLAGKIPINSCQCVIQRAPNKKKKNKTYQDGILKVLPSATCVLYDDAGNDIARKSAWKGAKGLKEGDEMEVCESSGRRWVTTAGP